MKEFTVEELENILIKKRRRSKHTAICGGIPVRYCLFFIISAGLLFKNDFATITVQAEAGEKWFYPQKIQFTI